MDGKQKAFDLCRTLDALIQPGEHQTQDPTFLRLLQHNDKLGHIFLIISPNHTFHAPKHALGSADLAVLANYFHRPEPSAKYWILKTSFRTTEFLMDKGWL